MPSERKGLSKDQARELTQRVLKLSKAEQARVSVDSGWRGYTRVATNRITSAGGSENVSVRITSVFGKRVASVSVNSLEEEALAGAVKQSETLARIAPENPEYMSELGPQTYLPVDGYYDSTGELATEARARAAALGIEAARDEKLVAAAYMDVRAGADALATSNGLFAYSQSTGVSSTLSIRTPESDSSGWAGDEAADWKNIESARIAADAARKCKTWRGKTALDPGAYVAILEPTAVGMLMRGFGGSLDARSADEGRSYFSKPGGGNRLGESLFSENVTITSDPAAPDAETSPFDGVGHPLARQTWIERGVVKNLSYSRYWAQKQGKTPLPGPNNILMTGGNATLDEMIASTEKGVLITRFWYIRGLNPRTISYTGLTRDGLFLIEKGKISRPVTNFRFNQSLVDLLKNIEMLGKPVRVPASEDSSVSSPIVVPPIKTRVFNLASKSDAI